MSQFRDINRVRYIKVELDILNGMCLDNGYVIFSDDEVREYVDIEHYDTRKIKLKSGEEFYIRYPYNKNHIM